MGNKKLSILIPVYNEEETIINLINKVLEVELVESIEKEIILVNDCSTDNSENLIQEFVNNNPETSIIYAKHEKNQGKGAALHTGIALATGDYLIVQDADLEYDPNEFNLLLDPMLKDKADVVYGSRFVGSQPHRVLFFWHSVGNKMLTLFSNMFTNVNLTDMETCYKLFKTEIIKSLNLREKRFGFEPEVTAKIARIANIRIYEVGISYYGRTYNEGKKIGWRDGLRAFYVILKYGLFKNK